MKHSYPLELAWLDAEYDALKGVDAAQLFGDWARRSQAALTYGSWQLDQRFGDSAAETLDVLLPPCGQAVRGVLMFIHGGFWRGSDKAVHRFIAPAFAQAGYAMVLPNYGLCPQVSIKTIVMQMTYARDWLQEQLPAWGLTGSCVVMAGHSAGGHVAAMLSTQAWAGGAQPWPALSLSGLHDLGPVAQAPFLRADLQLTSKDVLALSPIHLQPAAGARLAVMVGAQESAEFRSQSRRLQQAWTPSKVISCEQVPGATHFDMVQALADPASLVHKRVLSLFEKAQ